MRTISRRKALRWLSWLSSLVFVAGVVTATIVFFGNTAKPLPKVETPSDAQQQVAVAQSKPKGKKVPLDPKARETAGRFLLAAAGRENLPLAWKLSGPEIRQGLSYKEWLTGNIPVHFYPADAIDQAPMKVDESYENEVWLEVALLPKKGAEVKAQIFFLGLNAQGKGKNRRWVVNYFQPRATPGAFVTE